MNVFVSNPRLLFDLQFFLRRIGCATTQVHPHELDVDVPGAPSDEQARRELRLYLALWEARKRASGVEGLQDLEAYIADGAPLSEDTARLAPPSRVDEASRSASTASRRHY